MPTLANAGPVASGNGEARQDGAQLSGSKDADGAGHATTDPCRSWSASISRTIGTTLLP